MAARQDKTHSCHLKTCLQSIGDALVQAESMGTVAGSQHPEAILNFQTMHCSLASLRHCPLRMPQLA